MDLWYLLVSEIVLSVGNLLALEELSMPLVSWIAARELLIDNHIQAMLKNSLVRLHSTPYSSRVEGVGAKSVAL